MIFFLNSNYPSRPGATETTYHEFAQDSFQRASAAAEMYEVSGSVAQGQQGEESNPNKQLVMDLIEEAERRKRSMECKSSDMLNTSNTQHNHSILTSKLDSVPYSSGYTLEVLDQRVSDRFERVDEETIKSRYGVDSFQYLPVENNLRASVGGSFISSNIINTETVESNGNNNLSSLLTDLAKLSSK